jgi:hypothetical protein
MIPLRLGKTVQRLKKHAGVAAELMNKLFLQQEQLFVEDELLSIIGFSDSHDIKLETLQRVLKH